MIDLYKCCVKITSVGIIADFSEETETYIVGTPADIRLGHTAVVRKKLSSIVLARRSKK